MKRALILLLALALLTGCSNRPAPVDQFSPPPRRRLSLRKAHGTTTWVQT